MIRMLVSAALAIVVLPLSGAAQPSPENPPAMGVCQPFENDNAGSVAKASWTFDEASGEGVAKVTASYGDEYDGIVVGMRPHNDWFKFTIRFTDRFDKLNDLTIFYAVGEYRMGVVSFDLVDGERYVSSISAFQSAQCLTQ